MNTLYCLSLVPRPPPFTAFTVTYVAVPESRISSASLSLTGCSTKLLLGVGLHFIDISDIHAFT